MDILSQAYCQLMVEQVYVDEKGKRKTKTYVVDTDEGPETGYESRSIRKN